MGPLGHSVPRCVTQPLASPSSLGDVSGSQSGGQDGIRTRGCPEPCPPLSAASRSDALPVPQRAHTQLAHGALSTRGTNAHRQDSSTEAPRLLPNCFSTPSSSSLTSGIKNELQQSPEVPGSAGKCPRGSSDYRMGQGGRSHLQKSSPLRAASEPVPLPGPQAAITALSGLLDCPSTVLPPTLGLRPLPTAGVALQHGRRPRGVLPPGPGRA